jgi:CRP/FNR family transcriptional regulator, cyclic AMP receptor protein
MVTNPGQRGFLGGLAPDSRRKLTRLGRVGSYHPGQIIYSQDDDSAHVRVLLEGAVKLTALSRGTTRETLLEIRTHGDLLGEREVLHSLGALVFNVNSRATAIMSSATGRTARQKVARSATATALWRTQALVVSGERFTQFMASEPGAMAAMAADLEARLSEAEFRLGGIASDSANRRLARALLSLSMSTALPGVERTWLQLSQAELASWIGSSRETVERILGDWRRRGIIETGYRRIVVLQLDDLMRIAGARRGPRPALAASLRSFR